MVSFRVFDCLVGDCGLDVESLIGSFIELDFFRNCGNYFVIIFNLGLWIC